MPDQLPRDFYRRDSREVAPDLLNKLLVVGERVARIVEVEAYAGSKDPGSHAYRGMTERNRVMFGPPGHLYVYRSYGIHWCANAVCGEKGTATAVLLRAGAPESGVTEMWAARPRARLERDLCSGPGKLCQALGIDISHNGADLAVGPEVIIADDGTPPPEEPGVSVRIGLSAGADLPWRWFVPGDPNVSRGRTGPVGNTV